MIKYYIVIVPCLLAGCSTTPESLLARQLKACGQEVNSQSLGAFSNVSGIYGGGVDGGRIPDPTPPAVQPATMSTCMSFWDEELSRENDTDE